MKYLNEPVRRQDRLLEEEKALRLLQTAEYGILSMQAVGGGGYGIPVNYVGWCSFYLYSLCTRRGETALYLCL